MRIEVFFVFGLSVAAAHGADFAPLRYDDKFSATNDGNGIYAALKHFELGAHDRNLSIGGDLRERFEYFSNTNIGTHAMPYEGLLMHRLLLHADTHWDNFRLFSQLGNYEESGRDPQAKPTDIDHVDVRQFFIDYLIPLDNGTLTLRGGRQELAFGASRIVTARDGPNIRLAFDGLQIQCNSAEWKISAIAVRPAENTPAQFDDRTDRSQSLWGIYSTRTFAARGAHADFYYFGSINDAITFDSIKGKERRNTVGARYYGIYDGFDGDVEFILQNGEIGAQDIRAFALATDSGWTRRAAKWQPRIGLRTDVISGDRDRRDGTLGTFNALYPNGSYFSEASVLAQANLLDVAVSISIKPIARVGITWSINPLWRYSTVDALYSLPITPLIAGNTSKARYIGTQNQLIGVWQYNNYLSFKAALVKFEPGTFVQKGGGRNLDYAQFATSFRF
jgi:hypothetical protein